MSNPSFSIGPALVAAAVVAASAFGWRWGRARGRLGRRLVQGAAVAAGTLAALWLMAVVVVATHRLTAAHPVDTWTLSLRAPWARHAWTLSLAVVVASWWLTMRSTTTMHWRRRLAVFALRTAATLVLVAAAMLPVIEARALVFDTGTIAVVLDGSASMAATEGGRSRLDQAKGLANQWQRTWPAAPGRPRLAWYGVGDKLVPLTGDDLEQLAATAPRSDLLEALQTLADQGTESLAGVVLLSDGRDSSIATGAAPTTWLRQLSAYQRERRVPIHVVPLGQPPRDLTIDALIAGPVVLARTAATITAALRCSGLPPQMRTATLWLDGEALRRKDVRVCDGATTSIVFEFVPMVLGRHVVAISLDPAADEASAANNQRAVEISVVRDKLRVLHLASAPSWDVRAVREYLSGNDNIELLAFYVLRDPDDVPITEDDVSLIAFPEDEVFTTELATFDVVVLQNFDPTIEDLGARMEALLHYVQAGGGLLVLGGERAGFAQGGPDASAALTALMPFASGPRGVLHHAHGLKLTQLGAEHPATQLVGEQRANLEAWRSLPRLAIHAVGTVAPDAAVLAHTDAGHPVIAARDVAQGRVVASALGNLWRWWLQESSDEPGAQRFGTFLDALLRYLSRDEQSRALALTVDHEREQLTVALRARNNRPATRATVQVSIAGPAPQRQVLVTDEHGLANLPLGALPPGTYRAEVHAETAGIVHVATAHFVHDRASDERSDLSPNHALLAELARATGGKVLTPGQPLSELPLAPPRAVRVARASQWPLWRHPLTLVLVMTLLVAEWLLRRRHGTL